MIDSSRGEIHNTIKTNYNGNSHDLTFSSRSFNKNDKRLLFGDYLFFFYLINLDKHLKGKPLKENKPCNDLIYHITQLCVNNEAHLIAEIHNKIDNNTLQLNDILDSAKPIYHLLQNALGERNYGNMFLCREALAIIYENFENKNGIEYPLPAKLYCLYKGQFKIYETKNKINEYFLFYNIHEFSSEINLKEDINTVIEITCKKEDCSSFLQYDSDTYLLKPNTFLKLTNINSRPDHTVIEMEIVTPAQFHTTLNPKECSLKHQIDRIFSLDYPYEHFYICDIIEIIVNGVPREKFLLSLLNRNQDDHEFSGKLYNFLGIYYDENRKSEQAFTWYSKCLESREKNLGYFHSETAKCYNNICVMYMNKGDYKKALEVQFKTLEIRTKIFPKTHREFSSTFNNLGVIYRGLKEFKQAVFFQKKCLKIRKIPEHIFKIEDIRNSYLNLGYSFNDIENYDKAIFCFNKCLKLNHFLGNTQTTQTDNTINRIKSLLRK
jgi:tetratricopeptide (TPR) repeat protein